MALARKTREQRVYARRINALIPEASELAKRDLEAHLRKGGNKMETRNDLSGKRLISGAGNSVCAGFGDSRGAVGTREHCMWTEFFHKHMNRLAREQGLRTI